MFAPIRFHVKKYQKKKKKQQQQQQKKNKTINRQYWTMEIFGKRLITFLGATTSKKFSVMVLNFGAYSSITYVHCTSVRTTFRPLP